jgi:hypothetical protein
MAHLSPAETSAKALYREHELASSQQREREDKGETVSIACRIDLVGATGDDLRFPFQWIAS